MERDVAWKKYDEADLEALEHLAAEYIDFISDNKTERECAASAVALAEEHGYLPLDQAVREGRTLRPATRCGRRRTARRSSWRISGRSRWSRGSTSWARTSTAAPRPQAEPAVRVERVHAVRYALLRRHQELPVGHAAAGAARRERYAVRAAATLPGIRGRKNQRWGGGI